MAIQDNVSIIQTSQGSGGGVNYNIFTQLEEPEIKEGIWIQTNQEHQSITTVPNILWGNVMTDLPYDFYDGSAVVYNGEIHILGSAGNRTSHYKWDGSTWTSVSTLPFSFYYGSAVVYNGEIHILGGNGGSSISHYKWNGSSWAKVSTLPYIFYEGSAVVYDKSIYIIGTIGGTKIDSKSYVAFTFPEKPFNPYTLIIQRGNTSSGVYQACLVNTFDDIVGENNRLLTGFDDIWYFLETKLDTSSPVYYGDGTKWIKFKN